MLFVVYDSQLVYRFFTGCELVTDGETVAMVKRKNGLYRNSFSSGSDYWSVQ
jgi:hypothetical protein